MQLFLAVLPVCLIAFASAEDFGTRRTAALAKCKKDLGVADDVANIANTKKEATTEQEKCLLECLYTNLGLIKDGKMSAEGSDAISKVRFGDKADLIQKSKEIFDKCHHSYTASNEEKCGLGKHIKNCFIQEDSDRLNFFPKQ